MRKLIFSVTKMTDSFAQFCYCYVNVVLEFNTFKIKLTWCLRNCVLVLCYNKLFSIIATKGKQVAVPTKMKTFKRVSFNSSHHDRYKCSFPFLACQPTAIKWSFFFHLHFTKKVCSSEKGIEQQYKIADKTLNRQIQPLFPIVSLKSLLRALCQISTSILKWKKSSLRKAVHYSLNSRFYPDRR